MRKIFSGACRPESPSLIFLEKPRKAKTTNGRGRSEVFYEAKAVRLLIEASMERNDWLMNVKGGVIENKMGLF